MSRRRVELGEPPSSAAATILMSDRRHRELAARLLDARPVLLAQRLERGDVGLVVLGDVRRLPRDRQVLRRLAADVRHRLDARPRPTSRNPAGGRRPAAPPLRRRRRPRAVFTCAFTSSWPMRPPGPGPGTSPISTPISRANRRTDGAPTGPRGRRRRVAGARRGGARLGADAPRGVMSATPRAGFAASAGRS